MPLGFAFNQKQFTEMMQGWSLDPEKRTWRKYALPAYGGFIQKKDSTTSKQEAELATAIAADQTGDRFICNMFRCELDDREYRHTLDLSD